MRAEESLDATGIMLRRGLLDTISSLVGRSAAGTSLATNALLPSGVVTSSGELCSSSKLRDLLDLEEDGEKRKSYNTTAIAGN